jgi:hypothetical protein
LVGWQHAKINGKQRRGGLRANPAGRQPKATASTLARLHSGIGEGGSADLKD